jgi:hypothetical protein
VEASAHAIRTTQLYRTLLHEIGHHVGRLEYHARHKDTGHDAADELYFARPPAEREAAAHRYADSWASRLRANRIIPFAPILKGDPEDPEGEGLDPFWFGAGSLHED